MACDCFGSQSLRTKCFREGKSDSTHAFDAAPASPGYAAGGRVATIDARAPNRSNHAAVPG
jgi:hypothetical protein